MFKRLAQYCALGLGLAATSAMAFTDTDSAFQAMPIGTRVLRPALTAAPAATLRAFGNGALVQTDVRSGTARILSGGNAMMATEHLVRPTKVGLETVAAHYIATTDLGVEALDLTLNDAATLVAKDVQFLKYRVLRDGLVIDDATLDFRFNRGHLLQVANYTYAEAASDTRASIDGLDRAAAQAVLAESATLTGESYRVTTDKAGYHLVRVANFDVVATSGERFRVQIEAATAKVFEVRPTTYRLEGDARGDVYPRSYMEASEVRSYRDLNLTYTGGSVTTDANGQFANAPETAQPALNGFVGTRVKVTPLTGTKAAQTGSNVSDHWNVIFKKVGTPVNNDKFMAQSMVYFHANAVIQQAKRYISAPWLDQQLTANVNLADSCNAHWDGTTINLYSAGGGCANTGLIADVTYHEWGHGLDDNTGGIDDGAYSEGFGDVMSMMMTHSNLLGVGFRDDGSPVRDLDPDKVYPRDAGEVHAEGLIIASTYWDLFTALKDKYGETKAGEMVSNFALKSIYTASRYTDVYNALLVIDDDNGSLDDGTPNFCMINKIFAQHGLATEEQACNLAAVNTLEIDGDTDGDGVLEPGETAYLRLSARNAAATPVIGLAGVFSTPAGSAFRVIDSNISWDDIPSNDSRRSRDSLKIEIDANAVCGTSVVGNLALQAGARTAATTVVLTTGTSIGRLETVAATGLPMAIKDNRTVSAPIAVASSQWSATTTVLAARLKFTLTHTYPGDLVISLVAPDGSKKEVARGNGPGTGIAFDQDVSNLVKGFKGKGTWKLDVSDSASRDEGSLTAVELKLTPAVFQCD